MRCRICGRNLGDARVCVHCGATRVAGIPCLMMALLALLALIAVVGWWLVRHGGPMSQTRMAMLKIPQLRLGWRYFLGSNTSAIVGRDFHRMSGFWDTVNPR